MTLVATAAAAGTAAVSARWIDEDGLAIATYRTATPSRVPVVEVASPGATPDRPVAFLVHGFHCNKSMMVPLAKHLAARGVDAYAVDLPGHGASLEPFSEERARDAAREALEAIVAARGTRPDRVALIGHSYGANVLARIAGEGAGQAAVVMLGPSYEGGLSPGTTGNLLVLTAARDHAYIAGFARDLLRDATGGAVDAPGESSGDPSRGDARAWQVVPGTDHVSLLFSDAALERTSGWLAGALPVASGVAGPHPSSGIVVSALGLAAAVALACAVAAACSRRAAAQAKAATGCVGLGRLGAFTLVALALAVLLGRRFTLLSPVRLVEGERIASLLAIAGFSMLALGWGRATWPSARKIARGLPVAAAAFAIVHLAAVQAADSGIYALSLSGVAPERHGAAVVLAAALLPFFGFAGALLDGVWSSQGGGPRGAAWTAVAILALCAAIAAAVWLVDPRLGRFAGPFGAVCLFAMATGAILTRAARNPAVGAIFSSTVVAWIIAVAFVRY